MYVIELCYHVVSSIADVTRRTPHDGPESFQPNLPVDTGNEIDTDKHHAMRVASTCGVDHRPGLS